jgi:hypothetical protein
MADASITATPYEGALLTTQLLSPDTTIVLGDFGSPVTQTLTDDDGWLSGADDGVATFGGDPITYIGSGTATPGVDVGGIIVPLGTAADVVAFEAGGQIYFHYPDGPPNLLSAVAVVINLDADPYEVFTPLCFVAGTMIATPDGERPVETLEAGDFVIDCRGRPQEVLWQGGRTLAIPEAAAFDKWRPVRVRAHAFGPACPARDTFLSQQHRVYFEHPRLRTRQGHGAFAPARQMVNDRSVRFARGRREVSYHHVLCTSHVILLANGMPAESLLLSEAHPEDLPAIHAALRGRFPNLSQRMTLAAPTLKRQESEELTNAMANTSPLLGARMPAPVHRRDRERA